ncbi:MAG: hypothetical protein ACE5IJ_04695 [Thermoplasmata archaeon]
MEKVTDDSNHWLLARSLERDGFHNKAACHYLKDAREHKNGNVLRTALSTFCAGRCLALAGEAREAASLYIVAIRLYDNALGSVSGGSESEWLTERISYCRSKALDLGFGEKKRVRERSL